jgi:LysR family transcriptional regulator, glycine cleavage system transcriptional activator
MALRLPPLTALRLFEAAGRHNSFKLAAAELAITPSAVSHGIRTLEDWLNVELFERNPGQLVLTPAGSDYLKFVADALAMIATGTQRLPRWRAERRVIVSCAPTFAARLLLPRLDRFRARHPEIGLTIDTSHRQVNLPVDGVDLAIRRGRTPWPGLSSLPFFAETLVPVCAPAYLETVLGADGEADLDAAALIHVSSVTEDWQAWMEATGRPYREAGGALQIDTIHLAHEAAAAGLGIAIGRIPLCDRELAQGVLVRAASPAIVGATAYWLVGADAAETRPDIALFKDWLIEEMAGLGPPAAMKSAHAEMK